MNKCQSDGICYTSMPPQSKCKVCGTYWKQGEEIPVCKNPKPSERIKEIRKETLIKYPRMNEAINFDTLVLIDYLDEQWSKNQK